MPKNTKEPMFRAQQDEYGNLEKVDVSIFDLQVVCEFPGCFQIRYVKTQDRSQVHYCKVHSRLARLKLRAERARRKRAKSKTKSS
jgi:hypothetical protein